MIDWSKNEKRRMREENKGQRMRDREWKTEKKLRNDMEEKET
jgi:hypothetical protein